MAEYKLNISKGIKEVIFKYIEVDFPVMDTEVKLYDTYKLNIMLSDGLAAILNDRNDIYNTFSGDLLFFGPADIHHGRILRQGIHKYIEILIPTEFLPNYKAYHSIFSETENKRTNLLSPPPKERANILSIAENISKTIEHSAFNKDIILLSDLIDLLRIFDILYNLKGHNNNQNIPAVLETAIQFIKTEFYNDIQISDIAAAANCSSSYLSRIFRKHIGKSPYCYLTEYRLFVAERALRHGSTVSDAAAISGFCDSSVFIKCFKNFFGITPLKYKKKYRL